MDISFTCAACGKNLVIDDAGAGITIDCVTPDAGAVEHSSRDRGWCALFGDCDGNVASGICAGEPEYYFRGRPRICGLDIHDCSVPVRRLWDLRRPCAARAFGAGQRELDHLLGIVAGQLVRWSGAWSDTAPTGRDAAANATDDAADAEALRAWG
jgi:hypothetical protein